MSFLRHPAAPRDSAPGVVFRSSSSSSASQAATDARVAAADLAQAVSASGSNVAQARDRAISIGRAEGANIDIRTSDAYNLAVSTTNYDLAPDVAEALAKAGVAIAGEARGLGSDAFRTAGALGSDAFKLADKLSAGDRELARAALGLSGDISDDAFMLADKSQQAVVDAFGETRVALSDALGRVLTIAESADSQLSKEIFKWGAVIFIAALAAANGPAIVKAIR